MHETMGSIEVCIMKKYDDDGLESDEVSRRIGKHRGISRFIKKNSKEDRDDGSQEDISSEIALFEFDLGRCWVSRQPSFDNVLDRQSYKWNVENQQQQKGLARVEGIEKAEGLSPGLGEKACHKGDHKRKCIRNWLQITNNLLLTYSCAPL